ncbi:hypothetical protein [Longimicrobium sp.]|uniref:tetratricopeptide repeat protein n=1 Tax=Longimicrobium sp. TaxID=2029185 RepID=UPI002E321169|nr:hypothetical protein [Longimicrobium sp.]HEX6037558.1 hypothetical protein [Longimicrobium sp.]
MGIFDKLFGKKQQPASPAPASPPKPSASASASPAAPPPTPAAPDADAQPMMQAYDEYGRSILIPREEWRTKVLAGSLHAHWDNPDVLYELIIRAVEDGFQADVMEAADRLNGIDPIPERGATALAIVLMKNGALNEAERVLTSYAAQRGETGVVLTNLAKVYADRGEAQKAEETLWRGLQLDPNLDNAVAWYQAQERDRGGDAGALEAMRRVAVLPGSWRAQLWLARDALAAGDRDQALALYHESLSRVGDNVPALLLEQMSGDLGGHGLLGELVELTAPRYDAARHGVMVGNNLMKAYLDLGQPEAARQVLEQLHALQRPDWGPALAFWEKEIARAGLAPVDTPPDGQIPLAMLRLEGPVWAAGEPVPGLLPAEAPAGPVICFLGSTAEQPDQGSVPEHQLTDDAGRLSRALPLFLAEQASLATTARAETLVPWVMLTPGAFALRGEGWTDEEAAAVAGPGQEYVVVTHLRALRDPWGVQLRVIRASDGACVGTLGAALDSRDPADGVRRLADRLMALLAEQAGVEARTPPPLYAVPAGSMLSSYLVRLEQLLAIRCFNMEGADPAALNGTREMIAGNLQLCLDNPRNAATRLLLVQAVRGLRKGHENAVREFADRVTLLQREHPLPPEAHAVVQRLLDEALA